MHGGWDIGPYRVPARPLDPHHIVYIRADKGVRISNHGKHVSKKHEIISDQLARRFAYVPTHAHHTRNQLFVFDY